MRGRLCADRLPERVRPNVLAFGGVADGFIPFEAKDKGGQEVELKLASIVMKAVQVSHRLSPLRVASVPPTVFCCF